MEPIGLVLVLAGVAAVAAGAAMVRRPLATIRHLDATEANLKRYQDWRGSDRGVPADGPTGADIMRQQMRQRVLVWGSVIAGGVAAIVLGLLL